jgi:hypothetical protein
MYARNILEVVKRLIVDGERTIDAEDPVIGPTMYRPESA